MRCTILFLALVLVASQAAAGNNVAGKASLSWDRDGVVLQMAEPQSTEFPLFLHLSGAPDIHLLAVELRWTIGDSSGCYTVVSSGSDAACGWATSTPPIGDFEGDSTYTWKIDFQPGGAKSCVVYTVSSATCQAGTPAKFYLASVITKDTNGILDTLETLEQATIGSSQLPSSPASDVVPGIMLLEFNPGTLETDAEILGLRDIKLKAIRDFLK